MSKYLSEFHIRISTVFLALGIFCYILFEVGEFPGRSAANALVISVFGTDLATVLFGNLGPAWFLIGAIFAFGHLIAYRKKALAVTQHSLEFILCLLFVIAFPAY